MLFIFGKRYVFLVYKSSFVECDEQRGGNRC